MSKDFLAHHGITGQKWYHRRFQNKDGSLTAEGKKRYRKNLKKDIDKTGEEIYLRNYALTSARDQRNMMIGASTTDKKLRRSLKKSKRAYNSYVKMVKKQKKELTKTQLKQIANYIVGKEVLK